MTTHTDDYFEGVVGQTHVKKALSFYLDKHRHNGSVMPNILLTGFRGDGKSHLARKIARNFPDLSQPEKKHKAFYSFNGASIKNISVFLEGIWTKLQSENDYLTIFIDEAHGLPKSVQTAMLSIMEKTRNHMTKYVHNDMEYNFDFRKVNFILATTEDDGIFHALKDRLTTFGLQPYTRKELGEIVQMVVDDRCEISDSMLTKISHYIRRNARAANEMANHILSFGCPVFEDEHFEALKENLHLLDYGINEDELRVLEALSEGELSLGQLACRVGRPSRAMQHELEPYLISLKLMEIDGKRRITQKGKDFLAKVNGTFEEKVKTKDSGEQL